MRISSMRFRPSDGRIVTQPPSRRPRFLILLYHPLMPLIRCQKCGQAYDVPGVVAVRLPNSIATCVKCGEWLSGSKAALLARLLNPSEIKEVDLGPYRVDEDAASAAATAPSPSGKPRSIRIIA